MNINSYIKNKLREILKEYHQEFDLGAPWLETDDDSHEIVKYSIDYTKQIIDVEQKGTGFEVEFIDFVEEYWKRNPGTFEQDQSKLEEESFEEDFIKKALLDKNKFLDVLYAIDEKRDFSKR